jgi:putative DNA methylase
MDPMTERRRLIEELLPLTEISRESSKSIGPGAIHAIHTWFARRPLAACRAATFAALVDAPSTEQERDELIQLILDTLDEQAPQKRTRQMAEMRRRIRETAGGQQPTVLDPFAGGGSLPLEATRLGCEAHALDLNPVAVLTMLATVDYPMRFARTAFPLPPRDEGLLHGEGSPRTGNLVQAIEAWGAWLLDWVRPQLERFYPEEPDGGVPVAYFWAKTVRCTNPACGAEIPLIAHRWLSRRKGKPPVAYRLIPRSDHTLEVKILTGQAAVADDPTSGTMESGSVQCPLCPQTLSPAQVKAQCKAKQDGRLLLAVAVKVKGQTGLRYRPATASDRAAFTYAKRALAEAQAEHDDPFLTLVPDEAFPPVGALGVRPSLYGVRTWGEMHNGRQLLALVTLCRGVSAAYRTLLTIGADEASARAVPLYLALTMSRLATRLSEAARWHNKRETIEAATAGHRLPMLWDYAEGNPLADGSGSWASTLRWALPSVERLLGTAESPVAVSWGDASQLLHPDNSFDAVLTDPPYYDSVPYSYLADMQYVWLHRALSDIMPEHFASSLTPKSAEIIQDQARHGTDAAGKAAFEQGLATTLRELRRVLKPEGIALVMYSHTATSAWETLVGALIQAGLQVTASWPVETETAARRDWLGGAMLAATIFLVCRKRRGARVGYLDEVLPAMREAVRQALDRFWAAGIGGADFFVSAIGPALSAYSRYAEVRYASGQPVSVASFLTLVRQTVVAFSLERALHGLDASEVDPETQFALLWRWTYGNKPVETGAALLLDKAAGVELGELERRGLIARANGSKKMVLLGPEQRTELLEQGLPRAMAGQAPLVDVVYSAALLWRENRREELAALLELQGEATRRVAQALAELQSQESAERRLLMGMLGSWDNRPDTAPTQGKQLALDM